MLDIPSRRDAIDDLVILVHGFSAKRLVMWPLALRLRNEGFRVRQWSYPTLFDRIESHARRLREFLQTELTGERRIHIVAHSMGCIVVRAALNETTLKNLGRVVMLAPPNRGSPVAGVLSQVLGWVLVPTQELSDRPTSYVNRLGDTANMEVGILAAKYDLLIPLRNTRLASESKHDVVVGTHNSILFSPRVGAKAACFLKTGDWREPSGRK
jgi:pimeloyl-ACP methyl ester carboxylesterase